MIRLFLDRPPSVNHLFSNAVKGGRRRSERYTAWRVSQKNYMIAQRQKPMAGAVEITLTVQERAQGDLDNFCKSCLDLLVFHRFIEGDHPKIVRRITMQWGDPVWGSDKMGCLIEVSPAAEGDRERDQGTIKTEG